MVLLFLVSLLFDADGFCCLAFATIYYFCIYLRCAYVFVSEHLADCVDICAVAQEQGGVGVAEAVECNVLGDSGCREPFLELVVDDGRGYVLEYESCAWLSAKFVGFVRDRECCLGLGLFCFDADAVASVWVGSKVFPGELEDVASSESCEAGEE